MIYNNIITEDFISKYWQKKPFLFERNATATSLINSSPLSIATVIDLLQKEEVESRVVFTEGDPQELNFDVLEGPFDFEELKSIEETLYTYLIQDINQEFFEIDAYYNMFSGLSAWQQANVMVSYSNAGGSVGPHRDRYDVFLWQIQGERKWYLENDKRPNNVESKYDDLEILEDFKKDKELILKTGDILYIPPNVAHWGISQSESLSLSFAFRRPSVYDFFMYMISEEIEGELENDELFPAPELYGNYNNSNVNEIKRVYSDKIIELLEKKLESLKSKIHTSKSQNMLASYLGEESQVTDAYDNLPLDDSMILKSTLVYFPGIRVSYTVEKEGVVLFAGFEKFNINADVPLAEFLCKNKQFSVSQLLKVSSIESSDKYYIELCKQFIIAGVCFLK